MSESQVDSSHFEETVTEVLKQFTQDGGLQAGMSLESLQQKVEFFNIVVRKVWVSAAGDFFDF